MNQVLRWMVLSFCFFLTSIASADLVVLKNGDMLEGSIVKQTDHYVRLIPSEGNISMQEFLLDNVREVIVADTDMNKARIKELIGEKIVEEVVLEEVLEKKVVNLAPVEGVPEVTVSKPQPTKPTEVLTIEMLEEAAHISIDEPQAQAVVSPEGSPKNVEEAMERIETMTEAMAKKQGGSFSPQDLDQASMDALVGELEKAAVVSMKEQAPQMIGWFAKIIGGFLFVMGVIAFGINRMIDEGAAIEGAKPGFWRRFIAINIDLWLGGALIGVLMILPGLAIPLDGPGAMPIYGISIIFGGLYAGYIVFGVAKFGNTYGRYIMGVKVVDYTSGEKPKYKQAFMRIFTFILWPIEAMVLLLSKSKRRIGDVWANTRVIAIVDDKKTWFQRAQVAILIFILGFSINTFVAPIALNKMHIVSVARVFIDKTTQLKIVGNPQGVQIESNPQGTQGVVTFKLDDADGRSVSVLLVRDHQGWQPRENRILKKKYFGLVTTTY